MSERAMKLCLFGSSPDTSNMGVSALCYAVVGGLARAFRDVELTVFDEGRGLRPVTYSSDNGTYRFLRCGATSTRRLWQQRSYLNIRMSRWLGGLGNPAFRQLHAADAVLDISGGDSFCDLYGQKRFRAVVASKQLALGMGKPLILLPQTYGPYNDPQNRQLAGEIVRRASMCWARDERSFARLKELLGDAFDPQRHRAGVDVAFALEAHRPQAALGEPITTWLSPQRPAETVGLNVSGLIWNDPVAMRSRYGFKADYRELIVEFIRHLLRSSEVNIVLVPHVLVQAGHFESDTAAAEAVRAVLRADADPEIARAAETRVATLTPAFDEPGKMKWVIGKCDWFCGTRMHATIAGLSSGVPTAGIAYSLKTQGVFETCGMGAAVVDPRELDASPAVARLVELFDGRRELRARLADGIEPVQQWAVEQLSEIIAVAREVSASGAPVST